MNDKIKNLLITEKQRDEIIKEVSELIKDNIKLQQNLNQNDSEKQAKDEKLFLEILEIFDAIEVLSNYFDHDSKNNNNKNKRIAKNLVTIQKKILNLLKTREVFPLNFQEKYPDFKLCRVVSQEIRDDVETQTITKIIRQGFRYKEKILRPTEVVIAVKS